MGQGVWPRPPLPPGSAGAIWPCGPTSISPLSARWRTDVCRPAADTNVAICRILDTAPEDLLALMRKIPSDVHQTVSGSRAAQQFLREAQQMALTDQEWAQLVQALRRLRGDQ